MANPNPRIPAVLLARLESDFLKVDGLEPVVFAMYDPDGVPIQTVEVPFALPRSEASDLDLDPEFVATHNIKWWHIPRSVLLAADLKPNNQCAIIDQDGIKWAVYKIQLQALRTRYRFTCTEE